MAKYFTQQIKSRKDFQMVLEEPECTNICFWYLPPSLENKRSEPGFNEKLNKVRDLVREKNMLI